MRQISLGADRANGQSDARAHGRMGARAHGRMDAWRVLLRKTRERIFGISLWDSTLVQRLAQFPRFCVTMGKLVCALLVVASCGFFVRKGIPHGNAREFGAARSGAD